MSFWKVEKKKRLSKEYFSIFISNLIILFAGNFAFGDRNSVSQFNGWESEGRQKVQPLLVPFSCGESGGGLATAIAGPVKDDNGKIVVDAFPLRPAKSDSVDFESLSSFKPEEGDLKPGFATTSSEDLDKVTESFKENIISSAEQALSKFDRSRLFEKSNVKNLMGTFLPGVEPSAEQYKQYQATLEKYADDSISGHIGKHSIEVDCGNGKSGKISFVHMTLTEVLSSPNDQRVTSVVCSEKNASSPSACYDEYIASLKEYKKSGKALFAANIIPNPGFDNSLQVSTDIQPAGNSSPASSRGLVPHNKDLKRSGSRGFKQAGSGLGDSHRRRN